MRLTGVRLAAAPGALGRLGLDAPDDRAGVGGVTIEAVPEGEGILGLDLAGAAEDASLPLVETTTVADGSHPLGATAVDHVVVLAGDVEATIAALGARPRRLDRREGRTYGFVVAETSLLEFVGSTTPDGRPARPWGLALTVADLDAAAVHLGAACGEPRDAVQPGRRIATVRHEVLGLTAPVVLLSPRPISRRG